MTPSPSAVFTPGQWFYLHLNLFWSNFWVWDSIHLVRDSLSLQFFFQCLVVGVPLRTHFDLCMAWSLRHIVNGLFPLVGSLLDLVCVVTSSVAFSCKLEWLYAHYIFIFLLENSFLKLVLENCFWQFVSGKFVCKIGSIKLFLTIHFWQIRL